MIVEHRKTPHKLYTVKCWIYNYKYFLRFSGLTWSKRPIDFSSSYVYSSDYCKIQPDVTRLSSVYMHSHNCSCCIHIDIGSYSGSQLVLNWDVDTVVLLFLLIWWLYANRNSDGKEQVSTRHTFFANTLEKALYCIDVQLVLLNIHFEEKPLHGPNKWGKSIV